MDAREQRGVDLAVAVLAPYPRGARTTGSCRRRAGAGRYSVWLAEQRCSCPDNQVRRVKCKHIFAVEYAIQHRVEADGTETVTEAVRVTYSQDWSAYNAAQSEEGERLRRILADLCSFVEQPEQRMGRPRLQLSEMAFASVLKVYSGFSSRRFTSELRAAERAGLICTASGFLDTSLAVIMRPPRCAARAPGGRRLGCGGRAVRRASAGCSAA